MKRKHIVAALLIFLPPSLHMPIREERIPKEATMTMEQGNITTITDIRLTITTTWTETEFWIAPMILKTAPETIPAVPQVVPSIDTMMWMGMGLLITCMMKIRYRGIPVALVILEEMMQPLRGSRKEEIQCGGYSISLLLWQL